MLIQWSPHFVLHCANHCNSCKKILESHKDKRNMARIPTCFLLLPKRVSSGESGSLVSASPLIKGESQEYSRTLFRKLCSRCVQSFWYFNFGFSHGYLYQSGGRGGSQRKFRRKDRIWVTKYCFEYDFSGRSKLLLSSFLGRFQDVFWNLGLLLAYWQYFFSFSHFNAICLDSSSRFVNELSLNSLDVPKCIINS